MNNKSLLKLSALTLALMAASSVKAQGYNVTEIQQQVGQNASARSIDGNGTLATVVSGHLEGLKVLFNPVIDYDALDFEHTGLSELTDVEAAKAGTPNAEDYITIVSHLARARDLKQNEQIQRVARYTSAIGNDDAQRISVFDHVDDATGELTQSNDVSIVSSNAHGQYVGTAFDSQHKLSYVDENGETQAYYVERFNQRGFVYANGAITALAPADTTGGGWSMARGINNNGVVAGAMSVGVKAGVTTALETCNDPDNKPDVPTEVCIDSTIPNQLGFPETFTAAYTNSGVATLFDIRGALWQLDGDGEVTSVTTLGTLITPQADDDTRLRYMSVATAVNDAGIAVGAATNHAPERKASNAAYLAVVFDGDTVTPIFDVEESRDNIAIDINNHNVVVGETSIKVNGISRRKLFWYDYNSQEPATIIDGFFAGSNMNVRDINNNGLVVGEADTEVAAPNQSPPQRAFLYDPNAATDAEKFVNLNTLLPCDSPYTLVQANAINDSNEIAATALVERQRRHVVTGEPEVDENGTPVLDKLTVAVKLTPNPDLDTSCNITEKDPVVRKGASFSVAGIAAMVMLLAVRLRRRRNIAS